ncbi:PREDICTED: leucine-rich repeat-containing protein 14-like [Ficedula albicollis]|uniref:leucine-rich repeat-containing protein 14-like n=1 Tax=Ficedula albicollis TaxID=59894 RepID=UPI0007AD8074|nr:PREDICTED: leucine-rich repeat-containing protein 14-like [Ficedula albicollis]
MDSLLLLCARCILAQRPLPHILPGLYPVLFQLAFLDGKHVVLRDLVAAWPIQVLDFQQLVRRRELLGDHPHIDYIEAVIQAVVAQLRQELEEPGCDFSKRRLRVLDMTGLSDSLCSRSPDGVTIWSSTVALAKAFEEVSKHQQDFQRREPRRLWGKSKRHKGRSRATRATAVLRPSGVDIHADLVADSWSCGILHNALQAAAAGPLRLKCRVFKAEDISAYDITALLESLDRSCMRSVDLRFKNLELAKLSEILVQLSRFPELRSLKLHNSNVDVQCPTPESAFAIGWLTRPLEILPIPPSSRVVLMGYSCFSSLRVLDVTGLPDSVSSHTSARSITSALAYACVEVSVYQLKIQSRSSKQHKGCSRATSDTAFLQPLDLDVHADLCVDRWSYRILREALIATHTGPLRLKCRVFKAEDISAFEIVSLLVSLDPSCMRSVDLRFKNLELAKLSEILVQLSRFPELRSLKLHNRNVDVKRPMMESAIRTSRHSRLLESLPSFQGLNLGSSGLSGNLRQIRCFHAPALKSLDVNGLDVSKGFLEPLQLLLEKTSSSLLHLDLRDCRMTSSHLHALLPTLLCCSHLRFFGCERL